MWRLVTDLNAADASIEASTQRKILTKAGVNMLYSRYYLAMKDYPNANLYSQKVLDDPNSTLLAMAPVTNIQNFWTPAGETSTELIFSIDYNSADLPGANDALIAT